MEKPSFDKPVESEIIGGRALRSRRSIAAKKVENKENEEVVKRAVKTPAKTPRRKKSSTSLSSLSETPKQAVTKQASFAAIQENVDLTKAREEILALQDELRQIRDDKSAVDEQLKEALEAPVQVIPEPVVQEIQISPVELEEKENEIQLLKKQLEEAAVKQKENEELYEIERQKLEEDKQHFKGHFEQVRQSETEKLQKEEDDEADKVDKENEKLMEEVQRKQEEIELLRLENQKLSEKTSQVLEEKDQKHDEVESTLEILQKKLSFVDLAREEAVKVATKQQQLVIEVRDAYDDKVVKLNQRYLKLKTEYEKKASDAVRYRDDREKAREQLKSLKAKHEKQNHPSDPRRRGQSDDTDIRKGNRPDVSPEDFIITSSYTFQQPNNRRVVLLPGQKPPPEAHKVKDQSTNKPMRVAIEPEQ